MKQTLRTITALLLLCISTPLLSEETEGSYVRKSISGPNSIWANDDTLEAMDDMRFQLESTLKESVRIPRFDLNRLPERLFTTAKETLKEEEELTNATISKTMKTTVLPEIEKILNDPAGQKKRIDMLKRGKEKVSFAETKGKSANILSSDLETLFNSAYIYVPFVKKFETINNGVLISTKIVTGVAWYKVLISSSGASTLKHIKTISVRSKSSKVINYNSYDYTEHGEDYIPFLMEKTQELAIKQAGKKIQLEIKKIDDFKLAGIVTEAKGSEYKINVGTLEGLKLDDAYILMGYVEEDGIETEKELGFLRVTHVNDNQNDPEEYSTTKQQLGALQSAGGWVKEYPRTKTHVAMNLGYATGLNIDASEIPELKENATSAIVLEGIVAQNLAEVLGTPQLFGELVGSIGFIENTLDSGITGTTLLTSLYMNVKKKYWHRRHSTSWKLGVGYDYFKMSGSKPGLGGTEDYEYDIKAIGFLAGVGYEVLLTKNFSLTLSGQYKVTPFLTEASGKNTEGSFDLDASDANDTFSETKFGGAQVTLGFNYIFPSFSN